MRNTPNKTRLGARGLSSNSVVEYKYANFEANEVNEAYLALDAEITEMQLQLDKFNQTHEFEVDIKL